jgi:adenylyltransferase/sulfurtransferase
MHEELSNSELERYARHISLPQVGLTGQKKLKNASVLVVGAGGLGSPCLLYLAAAGFGKIGIIDDDEVDITNLQRQVIHCNTNLGELKVESAKKRLLDLNPEISVKIYKSRLNIQNALDLFTHYDIIIDGTDNFQTRYLINDACEILNKVWIFASIHQFEGQVSTFNLSPGLNYRDLFPKPPPMEFAPNCSEAGVLGVLPGIIGTIQAAEAIKIILGIGKPLSGKLFLFNALSMTSRILKFEANTSRGLISELSLESEYCMSISSGDITPLEYVNKINEDGWKPFLLDVRRPDEEMISKIEGTNLRIKHTEIPQRYPEIPKDRDIVIYCRSGARSSAVRKFLLQAGYTNTILNLKGGILNWSDTVDSNIAKY